MNKAWIYVGLTSLFEFFWIFGFNAASVWWQWALVVLCIVMDFHFLTKACEGLPTGTVYAVFAGIGTVGTSLMDIYIFGRSFSGTKVFFIVLLVIGVICLNLADKMDARKATKGLD